jgi:hypothetical protein
MADFHDDVEAQDDAPVGLDPRALIGSDAPRLITAAAIGAAVGAAVTHFMQDFRSGDEPPIRVKGGSMHFEILDDVVEWVEKTGTSKTEWYLSDCTKQYDRYKVVLSVVDDGGDIDTSIHFGKFVRLNYEDQAFVQLKPHQSHTRVFSHAPMRQPSQRVITHPRSIRSIHLGGVKEGGVIYTAQTGAPRFHELLILDAIARRRR